MCIHTPKYNNLIQIFEKCSIFCLIITRRGGSRKLCLRNSLDLHFLIIRGVILILIQMIPLIKS